ncbi:MAG TPA: hypothetical protein VLA41_00800 [Burkholderiales bacterium]|nr:hypothetical protein [Burkholderiales bacterium]
MSLLEWVLDTAGVYVTTVGALLLFLYLYRSPQLADHWASPEGKAEYVRHRRRLVLGTGLLAAWLVLENAATIWLG